MVTERITTTNLKYLWHEVIGNVTTKQKRYRVMARDKVVGALVTAEDLELLERMDRNGR